MAVVDRAQDLVEAIRDILTADAEIRALAGRTTDIVVPWDDLAVDGAVPIVAYALRDTEPAVRGAGLNTERIAVQYACFAKTKRDANRLAARIPKVLTWSAFNARSLDACLDPERAYSRLWPPHDPGPTSLARARADVTVTVLVTN